MKSNGAAQPVLTPSVNGADLLLMTEDFAKFAIDVGCVLSRVFDESNPLFFLFAEGRLAEQIGRLHDGLE